MERVTDIDDEEERMTVMTLSGTDTKWSCADGDTIMRSAIRAGLGFPYECNVGSCGIGVELVCCVEIGKKPDLNSVR